MRLIDADVLPNYKCQVTVTIGESKGPAEMRFVFWKDIEKAPAIDAVQLVHGRWIANNICSVCKVGIRGWAIQSGYKFCPFCGAKMDGGAEW